MLTVLWEDREAQNWDIAMAFMELASYEFQKGSKLQGILYKKVSQSINNCTFQIKSGRHCCILPSINFRYAKMIDEFLATGKIKRLEEYRRVGIDELRA